MQLLARDNNIMHGLDNLTQLARNSTNLRGKTRKPEYVIGQLVCGLIMF